MPSWAGGWDHQFGEPHALTNQFTVAMRNLARSAGSAGGQTFAEIIRALAAGGPGTTAVASHTQVAATQTNTIGQSGKVQIVEYFDVPSRVTTQLDKEIVQAQTTPRFAPAIYPVDKGGSGGGGMAGTINK